MPLPIRRKSGIGAGFTPTWRPSMGVLQPAEINTLNEKFWERETRRMHVLMADETVREPAFEVLRDGLRRDVPAYVQKSVYEALLDAERNRLWLRRQQALAG